jgi:cell division protein FtsI/penicillin-binding protein 2
VIPAASTTLTDKNEFETQWGALGQGKTLVSPFQLMLWQGAAASGTGIAVKPYLLQSKTDSEGNTVQLGGVSRTNMMFTPQAAQGVQEIMLQNAANHYSWIFGNRKCGVKSGTAQVKTNGREYENSFLAGFCLDENCPVAFCVMIEERTSADVSAAQIANTILNAVSDG